MKNLTTLILTLLVLGGCSIFSPNFEVLSSTSSLIKEELSPNTIRFDTVPPGYISVKLSSIKDKNISIDGAMHPYEIESNFLLGGVWGTWNIQANGLYSYCYSTTGFLCVLNEYDGQSYLEEALSNVCSEKNRNRYKDKEYREKISSAKECAEILSQEKLALEEQKQEAFNKLYSTCRSYGFKERDAIASCIQQEIFNEKQLALLKQQQSAQMAYVNQQQIKEQEETNIWLLLLEGVAENLADPNTWENARQNAEIQKLKRQQIFRNQ